MFLLALFILVDDPLIHEFTPFLFENEAVADSLIGDLQQIEIAGDLLYIRENKDPRPLVVNRRGDFQKRIGRIGIGDGPGDMGIFSVAMSVQGQSLWLVEDRRRFVHYFENGEHLHQIKIKSYDRRSTIRATTEAFAFNDTYVILPADPNKDHLAYAYLYSGEIAKSFPNVFLDANSQHFAVDKTFWVFDGKHFYCLFKYAAMMIKYNLDLKEVGRFNLEGPELRERTRETAEYDGDRYRAASTPHFYDFKTFRGQLYALSGRVLYQFDPNTGETLTRSAFRTELPAWQGDYGSFSTFSFFSDGTLILGRFQDVGGHFLFQTKPKFNLGQEGQP